MDKKPVSAIHLGVLAWEAKEPESEGIADIARARGHRATVFELDDVRCAPKPSGTTVEIQDGALAAYDVLLLRCDLSTPPWTEKVQKLLLLDGEPGVTIIDGVREHIGAASKRAMLQRLSRAEVPVPATRECTSVLDVCAGFDEWGAIVVKPALGFRGIDVERFLEGPTASALEHVAALIERHGVLLCQPYLQHEGDYRVLVVGSEVSLCTRFDTAGEHWKPFPGDDPDAAPVDIEYIEPSAELAALGRNAAKAMGLSTAGIDVVASEDGLTVIEVNPVPGWAAWPPEKARIPNTQVVDFVEAAVAGRTRQRGE